MLKTFNKMGVLNFYVQNILFITCVFVICTNLFHCAFASDVEESTQSFNVLRETANDLNTLAPETLDLPEESDPHVEQPVGVSETKNDVLEDSTKPVSVSETEDSVVEYAGNTNFVRETGNNILDENIPTPVSVPVAEKTPVVEDGMILKAASLVTNDEVTQSSGASFKRVVHVQKCCPEKQVLYLGPPGTRAVCTEGDAPFQAPVCENNQTHYWTLNYSQIDIKFIHRDPCHLKTVYDEDELFCLMTNSSLYSATYYQMLNLDDYCMETVVFEDGTKRTTGCLCASPPPKGIYIILCGTGELLSAIALTVYGVLVYIRQDIRSIRKLCICCFAFTMAASYLFTGLYHFSSEYYPEILTIIHGFIVEYLILSYFLWLNILFFDTHGQIKDENKKQDNTKKYLGIGFILPVLFILVTFLVTLRPAVPYHYAKLEHHHAFVMCIVLFYLTILCFLIFNLSFWYSRLSKIRELKNFTKLKQYLNKETQTTTAEQKNRNRRVKSAMFVVYVTLLLDMVLYCYIGQGQIAKRFVIRDVVVCLLGVLVACVFLQQKHFKRCYDPVSTVENGTAAHSNGECVNNDQEMTTFNTNLSQ